MRRALSWCAAVLLVTLTGCSTIRQYVPRSLLGTQTAGRVRRIAVLPFAYRDASGAHPCDMCPDKLVMDTTSQEDALLVTAFFYEALLGHPRIQLIPFDTVQAAEGDTMGAKVQHLSDTEKIDGVLVGGLLEMRQRLGDPRAPSQRAGASIYAALLNLPSGHAVWKRLYDQSPGRANKAMRQYERLVNGEEDKTLTAEEVAHEGVERMVHSLVSSIH